MLMETRRKHIKLKQDVTLLNITIFPLSWSFGLVLRVIPGIRMNKIGLNLIHSSNISFSIEFTASFPLCFFRLSTAMKANKVLNLSKSTPSFKNVLELIC